MTRAGGHEQAIVAVLNGPYDAGVTPASGVGEQAQGFRGDLRAFMPSLPTAHPDGFRQIERGAAAGYAPASHAMFEPVVAMARAEAAARRQR